MGAHAIPNEDAERNPATAHLFIINPLSGQNMDNLFSTHPDTGNRIAALMDLAGDPGFAPAAGPATQNARTPPAPWGRRTAPDTPPAAPRRNPGRVPTIRRDGDGGGSDNRGPWS